MNKRNKRLISLSSGNTDMKIMKIPVKKPHIFSTIDSVPFFIMYYLPNPFNIKNANIISPSLSKYMLSFVSIKYMR